MEKEEEEHYYRLICLVVDIGTEVLLSLFTSCIPPSQTPEAFLNSRMNIINILRHRKVLNELQYNALTVAPIDMSKFDIPLLCVLIRNLTNIQAPNGGWDIQTPLTTDASPGALINNLRAIRNTAIAHRSKGKLTKTEFEKYWRETESILVNLSGEVGHAEQAAVQKKIAHAKVKQLIKDRRCEEDVLRIWKLKEDFSDLVDQMIQKGDVSSQKLINALELQKKEFKNRMTQTNDKATKVDQQPDCLRADMERLITENKAEAQNRLEKVEQQINHMSAAVQEVEQRQDHLSAALQKIESGLQKVDHLSAAVQKNESSILQTDFQRSEQHGKSPHRRLGLGDQAYDEKKQRLVKRPRSDHVTIVPEIPQHAGGSEGTTSHEKEPLKSGLSPLIQEQIRHVGRDVDDGRIHDINVKWLEEEIEKKAKLHERKNQGMTEIYFLNDKVPEWGFRVVVKKVNCARYAYEIIPLMNEILAGRLRHHAIVPLLAKCKNNDVHYFVFPYMEKGDLMTAIADDTRKISNEQKADLNPAMRVRALYQIACAMLYIHTPVKDLRHRMFHGDITSRNIVLDKEGNIRLLDFGGAQELKPGQESVHLQTGDVYGTPGYTTTNSLNKLSTKTDCRNFGVLILEMLTGEPPKTERIELQGLKMGTLEFKYSKLYKKMWEAFNKEIQIYVKLKVLAEKCLAKQIDAKEITEELYSMLYELNSTDVGPACKKGVKCAMCMLNEADDTTDNLILQRCLVEKLHVPPAVCVACMRNSYINPIQCLRCRKTIHTKIGNTWAAILIEGFEEDNKLAAGIRNDLEEMRQLLISKYPLVTGIDEKNVLYTTMSDLIISVEPGNQSNKSPGATSKQSEFANQLGKLVEDSRITTIWIYYSGHHSKDSGFYIGKDASLSVKDFENKFLHNVTKDKLIFMDCCSSACFNSPNIKLQLNASEINKRTRFSEKGSNFTRLVIQSLKGNSSGQCWFIKGNNNACSVCEEYKRDDGNRFISGHSLYNNIYNHIKQYIYKNVADQSPPGFQCNLSRPSDMLIGYYTDKELKFDFYRDKDNTCCKVAEITTEEKLKTELLKQALNLNYDVNGEHLKKYWDTIRITIQNGPRDVDELCSIPEITRAWNSKLELSFGLRKLENIHMGRVGVFSTDYSAHQILKGYWQPLGELGTEDTNVVKIPWVELNTKEFIHQRELKQTEDHSDNPGYTWCWEAWEKLTDNQKIKKAKNVVFTVPEHHDRDDFMVIELEELEMKVKHQVDA